MLKKWKFPNYINPFKAQEETGVTFHRNFNSMLRRDLQKISYERRAYESVDEKSLSWAMSRKTTKKEFGP